MEADLFQYVYRVTWQLQQPDMELGHWITGSMGHLGHLSRPGHRVTGSSFDLGQLGLKVAGFPGHWVAGTQNVTQFHVLQQR